MKRTSFEKPVTVLVGLGFPRKIENAFEAYQLLSEMRLIAHHRAQKVALRACREAMTGTIEPETARSAFVAFAQRCGMLLSPSASPESDGYHPRPDAQFGSKRGVAYSL
jgi:Protein of unknown function (DUF982)